MPSPVFMARLVGAAALAGVALVAPPALRAAAAEPANGLYLRTQLSFGSLNMSTYYFKDGQVVENPVGDVGSFDFARAKQAAPRSVGAYRVSGGKLAVQWGDGRSAAANYEKSTGGCFGWDGGITCPVKSFGAGERLEGKFSGGASAGGGAVSSSATLTLSRDGRYTLATGGVVAPGGNVSGAAGSFGTESGTYDLRGTALTLRPSSGPARLVLTFPYDDGTKGEQPRRMYFNGGMLKRL